MQKITKDQRSILHILSLHPGGAIIRSPDGIKDLKALATTGLVCDVFERVTGEFFARLSLTGREYLNSTPST